MESFENRRSLDNSAHFFQHHGWLAPGVRLFRSISFPAKTAWIVAFMLIPMVGLLALLYRADAELISTTQLERQGLVYVNAVDDLAADIRNLRRAATNSSADLPEKSSAVAVSFAKVQQLQKDLGAAFGGDTNASFAKLSKGTEAALQRPAMATPDETFALHTDNVSASLALLGDIADSSGLSLDPELDTYHMMNLVVVVGPQYAEYLARLRGLGVLSLGKGAGQPLPPERRRLLDRDLALIDYVDPMFENSYRRGIEAFPEVAKTMDMKGMDSSREAFLGMVQKQVMVDAPAGDPVAFRAAADAAVNSQLTLNKQITARLDSQLLARIDRVKTKIYLENAAALIGLAIALYLFLCFYTVMKGGLALVSKHIHEMTEGDLRHRPAQPWGNDEPAALIVDLYKLYDSMHDLIRRVRHSARELANTSAEVSRASLDLSARTEEAASSLGQQASAVEQIGSQVRETAHSAQRAATVAQGNAEVATKGGRIIADVVTTMREIQQSSSKISDIIGTIDGIAFQTNILALNAAVEAARAGESGRGFAVVASEVRSLAGRSAEAAREIKSLISASVERVSAGTEIVEGAGKAMTELVSNATQINTLLGEISVATSEQSRGVEEVVKAIHQLDAHTQQNAALVEETSAAAGALSEQAIGLTGEIARFRVA